MACHSPQRAPSVPGQAVLLAGAAKQGTRGPRGVGTSMSQRLSRAQITRELDWGSEADLSMWAWALEVLILPGGSSVPSTPEPKPGRSATPPLPGASGTPRAQDQRAGTLLCALEGRRPALCQCHWGRGGPGPFLAHCVRFVFLVFHPGELHLPPTVSGSQRRQNRCRGPGPPAAPPEASPCQCPQVAVWEARRPRPTSGCTCILHSPDFRRFQP